MWRMQTYALSEAAVEHSTGQLVYLFRMYNFASARAIVMHFFYHHMLISTRAPIEFLYEWIHSADGWPSYLQRATGARGMFYPVCLWFVLRRVLWKVCLRVVQSCCREVSVKMPRKQLSKRATIAEDKVSLGSQGMCFAGNPEALQAQVSRGAWHGPAFASYLVQQLVWCSGVIILLAPDRLTCPNGFMLFIWASTHKQTHLARDAVVYQMHWADLSSCGEYGLSGLRQSHGELPLAQGFGPFLTGYIFFYVLSTFRVKGEAVITFFTNEVFW